MVEYIPSPGIHRVELVNCWPVSLRYRSSDKVLCLVSFCAPAMYLRFKVIGIDNVRPRGFVNGFGATAKTVDYQLTIDGNNMSPLNIQAYQDGDNIILHSSLNGNAYFKKGGIDIFDQLFVSEHIFLPALVERVNVPGFFVL